MTFGNRKVREFVEYHIEGKVLNATAGETVLSHPDEIVRNDINPDRPDLDSTVDVHDLLDVYEPGSYDTIVYDPPFTDRQAADTYGTDFPGYGRDLMEIFDQLLVNGGKVITVGYTTDAMPPELGYHRDHVCLVNTFGRMWDFFVVVDSHVGDYPSQEYSHEAEVVFNGGHRGQSSRSTQTKPINMTYIRARSEPQAEEKMASFIDSYARGWTLDLYSQAPTVSDTKMTFRNVPPDQQSHEAKTPHSRIQPEKIDHHYSHHFETVVFNPGDPSVFVEFSENGSVGRDKAIKQAIDSLIWHKGRVIQVGPLSSLMPNDDSVLDFSREAVGIFSYPGADRDTIVTVDLDSETEYTEAYQRQKTLEVSSGPTRFTCMFCNDSWYAVDCPALKDIPCPDCGANQGSYCIQTVNGVLLPVNPRTGREGLCMERENWAREALDEMDCPNNECGHVLTTEQYAPFIP